jgi:hypothetical protein
MSTKSSKFIVGITLIALVGCGGSPASTATSIERACGQPGATGNALGVGKYCTHGGGECAHNEFALFCTVDFEPGEMQFCTNLCHRDSDCGEGAFCSGEGMGERGCEPMGCGGHPSSDAGT